MSPLDLLTMMLKMLKMLARILPATLPCPYCRNLVKDKTAVFGLRCIKGETSDQCGDFSCFEHK
jgi:hypothetical protein